LRILRTAVQGFGDPIVGELPVGQSSKERISK